MPPSTLMPPQKTRSTKGPSILRGHSLARKKSKAANKSVKFARASPGPGELPLPPPIATLVPHKSLEFNSKEGQVLSSKVTITNPGTNDIVFKIKTTSPTNYRVRPNTGALCRAPCRAMAHGTACVFAPAMLSTKRCPGCAALPCVAAGVPSPLRSVRARV